MKMLPQNVFSVNRKTLYIAAGVLIVLGLICFSQQAEAEISAGLGLSNQSCGTAEPNASIAYDRDGDVIPAHFRLGVGPNGSCDGQGITVDALVEGRYYVSEQIFSLVGAGYDLRTVPIKYATTQWGTKQLRGERSETVQALFGLGFDGGDWSIQAAYNVVDNKLSNGDNLFPVQINARWNLNDFEVSGTTNTDTHTVGASYKYGKILFTGEASFGFHKLENSAPDYLRAEMAHDTSWVYWREDSPSPLYNFIIEWVF